MFKGFEGWNSSILKNMYINIKSNQERTTQHCFLVISSLLKQLQAHKVNYFLILIEEGKLKRAEDFLIAAYWTLLKHNPRETQTDAQNANAAQKAVRLSEQYKALNFLIISLESICCIRQIYTKSLQSFIWLRYLFEIYLQ